jgi:hypothetical protein
MIVGRERAGHASAILVTITALAAKNFPLAAGRGREPAWLCPDQRPATAGSDHAATEAASLSKTKLGYAVGGGVESGL